MNNKIKNVQEFYNNEINRYIQDRYEGESCEHLSYLIRKRIVLDYLSDAQGSILDAGCGPGIFTKELTRSGMIPFSVDLSLEMLKKARGIKGQDRCVSWINCQIEQLPFPDDTFDNVMAIGVLAYASDTLKALKEITRVLKQNGMLVIQCSNSLAPAPNIVGLKDKIFYSVGLRSRRLKFKLIKHSYSQFRYLLELSGLQILEKCSYDFRLPFMEKISSCIAVKMMKFLQQQLENSEMLGWIGEGYVVKAKKKY